MTAYGGFQVCHSSVPGVLALSVHHPQKVSSMLLVAENISLLFQQLSQVIMLSYGLEFRKRSHGSSCTRERVQTRVRRLHKGRERVPGHYL